MPILNNRIKERRIACGYTLQEVAEKLGVAEATIQRYESGKIKNIRHQTIDLLAKVLRCDPSYLLGWNEEWGEDQYDDYRKAPDSIKKEMLGRWGIPRDLLGEYKRLNSIQQFPQPLSAEAQNIARLYDMADDHARAIVEVVLRPFNESIPIFRAASSTTNTPPGASILSLDDRKKLDETKCPDDL